MAFQFKNQIENIETRSRVNGSSLMNHVGKPVSIMGNILSVSILITCLGLCNRIIGFNLNQIQYHVIRIELYCV